MLSRDGQADRGGEVSDDDVGVADERDVKAVRGGGRRPDHVAVDEHLFARHCGQDIKLSGNPSALESKHLDRESNAPAACSAAASP